MNRKQSGFTLVEIAIVLVIIGLLLGGILKGQELINSARVRNLADTASGVQAAYFGFLDRYRRVPGDWDAASATTAIGTTVNFPVLDATINNNGRIDNPAGKEWVEPNAMWEQLAKAGFIQGSYTGTATEPNQQNGLAPLNAFNAPMVVGRTADYQSTTTAAVRLHLVTGRFIPAKVMRELDVKIDDALPQTGSLRAVANAPTVFAGVNNWGGHDATAAPAGCVTPAAAGPPVVPASWNVTADSQDCNAVILF
ncbi:MAG: prepilin-type N-terminal cleavage/methylation domain-containing protein [Gammaproteobacteria bacterium]|nr:prepilin-type N-terminal cleavage/methylation domain-containing protein [Gammaproteobacteria bacterium]MDH3412349.1 prepilin-type N-terminal cleavage/methylation domain-containing protein [Gammaproteobacteria bacterium]